MCGIAGIFSLDNQPVPSEEVRRMCAALYHRGPNEDGFYFGESVGLGMRRLSIIDLKTGRQPVANEDGSIWVVFNGEIYNFRELRRDLKERGHAFATETDTEVIVHLYEEFGTGCVRKLRGMFGIALWDDRRKQLLLARDRVGIKPLYYAMAGGRLVFASELKGILEVNEIGRDINWRSFNHLLTFLATPRDESIIEGVRKLEPGCLLTASRERGVRTESYWDLSFSPEARGDEDYFAGRLRELLEESVRLHLASDVPLGAFLSGGIDSSAVVATMARLTRAPVKTFSIGFGERDYDELAHARVVAKEFGTEHHELVLQPDVLDSIEDLAWHLDEPFGDSSAIPTYMVSKLAAEHVTVILSGDGGDELFGGYDKYAVEERERAWRLPGALRWLLGVVGRSMPYGMRGRNFARHFALSGWERYLDALVLFREEEKRELLTREAYETLRTDDPLRGGLEFLARGENGHWLSGAQYFDFMSYLPLDILTKVDRMSMAHSLEARVPLLDHRLIEFAATIPPELLLREGATKRVFKRAMRGILPDPIIDRRKQGFAIPLGRWFGGKLGSFVRELLLSRRSRARGVLNPAYVEKLLKLNESGRPLDLHLWTLMSFELWCRAFLDGGPRRSVTSSRSVAVWNRGRSGAGVLRPAARPRLAAT